jgi:hypothetical protein
MMNTPDWLSKRGGALQQGVDGRSIYFVLNNQPHYRLRPVPADGQYGCAIVQTINSRTIASQARASDPEAAIQNGLEDLRKFLGWE